MDAPGGAGESLPGLGGPLLLFGVVIAPMPGLGGPLADIIPMPGLGGLILGDMDIIPMPGLGGLLFANDCDCSDISPGIGFFAERGRFKDDPPSGVPILWIDGDRFLCGDGEDSGRMDRALVMERPGDMPGDGRSLFNGDATSPGVGRLLSMLLAIMK